MPPASGETLLIRVRLGIGTVSLAQNERDQIYPMEICKGCRSGVGPSGEGRAREGEAPPGESKRRVSCRVRGGRSSSVNSGNSAPDIDLTGDDDKYPAAPMAREASPPRKRPAPSAQSPSPSPPRKRAGPAARSPSPPREAPSAMEDSKLLKAILRGTRLADLARRRFKSVALLADYLGRQPDLLQAWKDERERITAADGAKAPVIADLDGDDGVFFRGDDETEFA